MSVGKPTDEEALAVSFAGSVAASSGIATAWRLSAHTCQWREVARHVLGREHSANQVCRPFRQGLERFRKGLAGGRIVTAVKPEFRRWRSLDQRACLQPLHSRRPVRVGDGAVGRGVAQAQVPERGDGHARVGQLMRPSKIRYRKVEKAEFVSNTIGHALQRTCQC